MITRRQFLNYSAGSAAIASASGLLPAWAMPASKGNLGIPTLTGSNFDLHVSEFPVTIDGRKGAAIGVNGTVPAPLLRFREGDDITIRVHNMLDVDTSIHWHGLLVPFHMDGVPGVSFPGIKPHETFTYKFALPQNGTYWYHSHSGLQEQIGHYGPIIIDPHHHDPVAYDREYIMVLSDWSFESPERIFSKLKKVSHGYNFQERTLPDFLEDVGENGLSQTLSDRAMWGGMRMSPRDISDVTGSTYHFLINGHTTADNWNAVFNPGERVRLRIINASAMTIFNVRIPGLPMTVVQSDGLHVQPLEVDEFQMGVAETYDVIVEPKEARAYGFVAEAIDRSGQVVATLGPQPGMKAEEPELRAVPTLTMRDMGMMHGDHAGHDMGGDTEMDMEVGMDHSMHSPSVDMDHSAHAPDHKMDGMMEHSPEHKMDGGMDHSMHKPSAAMDHSMHSPEHKMDGMSGSMDHGMHDPTPAEWPVEKPHLEKGPGVANINMMPIARLDEPGLGLEDVPHRTLRYSQLRSLEPNPDTRPPEREVEIHLTSNMERYMWSFDGVRFSEVKQAIQFNEGERVRVTLVNNTMMSHPIHLHGMFFDLVNGGGNHRPRKHTVTVKPAEKLSFDVSAEHVGDWAFHCHLLYHMMGGMMQVVSVLPNPDKGGHDMHDMHKNHDMHGGHDMHPSEHGDHTPAATDMDKMPDHSMHSPDHQMHPPEHKMDHPPGHEMHDMGGTKS